MDGSSVPSDSYDACPSFPLLTGTAITGGDEVQIRQKYLLLEQIKTLLNGVSNSFYRVSATVMLPLVIDLPTVNLLFAICHI
jgi:hypothetical protein